MGPQRTTTVPMVVARRLPCDVVLPPLPIVSLFGFVAVWPPPTPLGVGDGAADDDG